jgi:ATP-dependent Clp protease ATP-binding subunit ClpA
LIAEVGFDPVYSARPLKSAIKTKVEKALAKHILSEEFQTGQTITISIIDGEVVFHKSVEAPTEIEPELMY